MGKFIEHLLKKNSPHHQLWADSIKVLDSMRFVGINGKNVSVPTMRNWMTTIRGLCFWINLFNHSQYHKEMYYFSVSDIAQSVGFSGDQIITIT